MKLGVVSIGLGFSAVIWSLFGPDSCARGRPEVAHWSTEIDMGTCRVGEIVQGVVLWQNTQEFRVEFADYAVSCSCLVLHLPNNCAVGAVVEIPFTINTMGRHGQTKTSYDIRTVDGSILSGAIALDVYTQPMLSVPSVELFESGGKPAPRDPVELWIPADERQPMARIASNPGWVDVSLGDFTQVLLRGLRYHVANVSFSGPLPETGHSASVEFQLGAGLDMRELGMHVSYKLKSEWMAIPSSVSVDASALTCRLFALPVDLNHGKADVEVKVDTPLARGYVDEDDFVCLLMQEGAPHSLELRLSANGSEKRVTVVRVQLN